MNIFLFLNALSALPIRKRVRGSSQPSTTRNTKEAVASRPAAKTESVKPQGPAVIKKTSQMSNIPKPAASTQKDNKVLEKAAIAGSAVLAASAVGGAAYAVYGNSVANAAFASRVANSPVQIIRNTNGGVQMVGSSSQPTPRPGAARPSQSTPRPAMVGGVRPIAKSSPNAQSSFSSAAGDRLARLAAKAAAEARARAAAARTAQVNAEISRMADQYLVSKGIPVNGWG